MPVAKTKTTPTLTDLLFEKAHVGLCLVAPDGTVLRANAAWLSSTGFTHEQVIGESIIELFPATRDMSLAMHARARAGHRVEVPPHAQTVNGRESWWEESIDPVPMEGGTGLLITAREVSARVNNELDRPGAITHEEAKFRSLFENSMNAVYVTHGDGVVLDANPAACRMHGMTLEEIRERGRAGLIVTDEALRSGLERRAATGQARAELTFLRKDGTTFPVEVESIFMDRSSPRPLAFTIARDITDQKRAERVLRESEERLRALADSMPLLAWTARPDGYIHWFNRRCCEYTGKTPEELEGWNWQRVHDPATLPEVLRAWNDAIEAGRTFDMEFPLRGADGKFRRFLSRAFPLKDDSGNVVQWFGTHTDVTELVEAREVLRAANRSKDEFLAVLSHELRNPLAPIRNSAYILRRTDPGSEQARRAQDVIERQTEHLTKLVDDLLDLTRIARGKIELRRAMVDLREVLPRAADDFRTIMDERGLDFRIAVPAARVWADVDATRLTQVIGNLLHNAAKFTPRGGEVVLSLAAVDGSAEIRVRDTGAGIEAGLLPTVFDAFTQGMRTLARSEGGLGLGLAMVKGIAELHGGSVLAKSAGIGRGAEFVVRLPLAIDADAGEEQVRKPGSGAARRVLVVDDNRDAAESLADILRLLGHTVDVAYDGPSAVEKVRASPPNVVLCDIGLPGMSGYEVAKALRAAGKIGVQLFALSGYAQPEDVQRAIEAGFDGHVAKPCDPEQIERLLA
jgi:PAS domain S-box-containing protein